MKVLTFNICWEAMTRDKTNLERNGGKAKTLGKKCILNKKGDATVCLDNVVKMIDGSGDYDIVALQEALNYRSLIKKSKVLKKMGYYKSRSGKEIIITFYNKKKYNLVKGYSGEFMEGRPYHVLELIDTKEKRLFVVNLHTGHGELCKKLYIQGKLNKFLRETIDLGKNKLIVLGDFNNHNIKTLKVMGRNLRGSKKKYRNIVDNVLSEQKVYVKRYLKCELGSDHVGLVCEA
jgi:endonuclease/exonuclease/phosphatase family metal-dependent hydrolase